MDLEALSRASGKLPPPDIHQGDNAVAAQFLVEHGANVNSIDEDKDTPLHFCAAHGSRKVAAVLIKAGAKIDPVDEDGDTPLYLAAEAGDVDIVQLLLDAVVDYLPSPSDRPPVEGIVPKTKETVLRKAEPNEPFSALAFKVMSDPYVGKLTFFRVYSGTLAKCSYVYNSTKDKKERIGRVLRMHMNHR